MTRAKEYLFLSYSGESKFIMYLDEVLKERMEKTDGYYRTIKKMVSKQEKKAGLQSLWGINRLDESCEYFVALTEVGKDYEVYYELFTNEKRAYCDDLLENDYGFNFKTKSWK